VLTQIIIRTPLWVWILLVALLALGYSQTRHRSIGFKRAFIFPLVMVALSLLGTVSAFGTLPVVLGLWLAVSALVASIVMQRPVPTGTAYDSDRRRFALPGSWLPMGVILAIFLTKYVVGVSLSMQPALATQTLFAMTIGTLYGVFSGFFAGRTLRLWRMTQARTPTLLHA
jgi:hypothetical protein